MSTPAKPAPSLAARLNRFVAGQLGNPPGLVGRLVLAPMWNRRNAALNEQALTSLALRPDDRVLEIGFGGGYLLGRMSAALPQGFVAGVDISPAMVDFCRRRYRPLIQDGRLELECASAESLPFPFASFDKICSVNSIFYWQDVQRALAECRRVLKEDGSLVLCFTCRESLEARGFAKQGLHVYEAAEIEQLMFACHFGEIKTKYISDKYRRFACVVSR